MLCDEPDIFSAIFGKTFDRNEMRIISSGGSCSKRFILVVGVFFLSAEAAIIDAKKSAKYWNYTEIDPPILILDICAWTDHIPSILQLNAW